jgi:hypothetical protein
MMLALKDAAPATVITFSGCGALGYQFGKSALTPAFTDGRH